MIKFFNKVKSYFWHIFDAKPFFSKNPAPCRTTSYGFLTPRQNLEKTNDQISRKSLGRLTDKWTDPFYKNLPTIAGVK